MRVLSTSGSVRVSSCLPFVVMFSLAALGCRSLKADVAPPYEIKVSVASDPGTPLARATLSVGGHVLTTTDASGSAILQLSGTEGEAVDVFVGCPEGFRPIAKPLRVTLRRLADHKNRLEYAAQCPPKLRTTVVVVRTEHGPNLPILRLGKEIGRTNEEGAAHLSIQAENQEQVELTLGTQEKGNEGLRPQNPAFSFVVKDQDDILLFEQRFAVERPKVAPTRAPRPTGPVRF